MRNNEERTMLTASLAGIVPLIASLAIWGEAAHNVRYTPDHDNHTATLQAPGLEHNSNGMRGDVLENGSRVHFDEQGYAVVTEPATVSASAQTMEQPTHSQSEAPKQ